MSLIELSMIGLIAIASFLLLEISHVLEKRIKKLEDRLNELNKGGKAI